MKIDICQTGGNFIISNSLLSHSWKRSRNISSHQVNKKCRSHSVFISPPPFLYNSPKSPSVFGLCSRSKNREKLLFSVIKCLRLIYLSYLICCLFFFYLLVYTSFNVTKKCNFALLTSTLNNMVNRHKVKCKHKYASTAMSKCEILRRRKME